MPYSPESHLISSIILNGDLPTAIARGVTSDMFHVHPDEWAWVMEYVAKYHRSPTRVAFMATFKNWRLARVDDTEHFADEVRQAHVRHLLLGGMNELADFIADGDLETALKKLHALTIGAAAGVGIHKDTDILRDFEDVWTDAIARQQRYNTQGSAGIPTGIPSVDDALGGVNPGELAIFAARPGEGKTWTMLGMGGHAVTLGHTVQFNSMEMSRSQVAYRLYSLLSGSVGKEIYRSNEILQGKVPNMKDFRVFIERLRDQIQGRLHLSDASRGQVSSMTVASQIERNKPDIVYLDYIGLMKRDKDWQGMAALTGELKQIAVEYNVAIVAAAQLNREHGLGKEPPSAEAIALSDSIGQDADMIVTQKKFTKRVTKMRLAKTRHGENADEMWYMRFEPGAGIIKEISANKALDLMDQDKADAQASIERAR